MNKSHRIPPGSYCKCIEEAVFLKFANLLKFVQNFHVNTTLQKKIIQQIEQVHVQTTQNGS